MQNMRHTFFRLLLLLGLAVGLFSGLSIPAMALDPKADDGALAGVRHRVIVSTDIGGTDPDDVQSMVHLLVYADIFDIEGLISSPYGPGHKKHILELIDAYQRDYSNLKTYSENYPTPEELRAITRRGALESPGPSGVGEPTEGSRWIVECARRKDQRPLHLLVWGGMEDLAQALHDAPDILPKLRVYFIGGPNKKWSVDAYNYVEQNHPKLWMIEANATYRGWFVGGNQKRDWDNKEFVTAHAAGHGTLGDCFVKAKADIKMGDTPSVARLLRGVSEDPTKPGWGGKYVPIWDGRTTTFDRLTTEADKAEVFGVTEFALPRPEGFTARNTATMIFEGGKPPAERVNEGKVLRFRFSPRDAKVWLYVIKSDFPGLDGKSGKVTAVPPPVERTSRRSTIHPNWWIDDPAPAEAEGVHPGAKSVSQWREEFLGDFAAQMKRCTNPAPKKSNSNPAAPASQKPRVIVTTDGEVDDQSSMVRFLLYTCDFDVAGIVEVNSRYQKNGHSKDLWIDKQLKAYEEVLPNLRKHNPDYPDAKQLRGVMRAGNENIKDLLVAPPDMETKDTAGAQLIIDTLLDDDPRPAHVISWGGANTTASALWKLKAKYPKEKFEYAVSRIRIYCIWYQDGGGSWIQKNIPEAHINEAYQWDDVWDYESISDNPRKRASANPAEVQRHMGSKWLADNVTTGHGPLGALYPQKYVSEGDTSAFLHLVNNGLDSHRDYTLGGWGGRSAYDDPKFPNHVTDRNLKDDGNANKMYWRWIPAVQNDFAARMDWCVKEFKDANHPPVAKVQGNLRRDVKASETVDLVATATDPDGNKLTCKWWQYVEAGTAAAVTIANRYSLDKASFVVPNEPGKQIHIILEVTDNGTPPLVRYQRVICTTK